MGSVAQVTRFVTTDGAEHENLQVAQHWQNFVDLKDAFRAYQKGRPGGMSMSGFFDFLEKNKGLISDYLAEGEVK
jgi:hypothetical protein